MCLQSRSCLSWRVSKTHNVSIQMSIHFSNRSASAVSNFRVNCVRRAGSLEELFSICKRVVSFKSAPFCRCGSVCGMSLVQNSHQINAEGDYQLLRTFSWPNRRLRSAKAFQRAVANIAIESGHCLMTRGSRNAFVQRVHWDCQMEAFVFNLRWRSGCKRWCVYMCNGQYAYFIHYMCDGSLRLAPFLLQSVSGLRLWWNVLGGGGLFRLLLRQLISEIIPSILFSKFL